MTKTHIAQFVENKGRGVDAAVLFGPPALEVHELPDLVVFRRPLATGQVANLVLRRSSPLGSRGHSNLLLRYNNGDRRRNVGRVRAACLRREPAHELADLQPSSSAGLWRRKDR